VAIPTLVGGETLAECVRSVVAQTYADREIVVVDNSGQGLAAALPDVREHARVIENRDNKGFGAAVNQAFRTSDSPFLAVMNDDAVAHSAWLETMVRAVKARYEIGMCAPQIRLYGTNVLDSAGMLLCADGSSKQRGHLESPTEYARATDVLFPSGCAALYKRAMLDEIGLFDEDLFLYCEDTDLGLRARWAMWECAYVPDAVVEHRYSHSSGQASALKAWYVERNRLRVAVKNLPWPMLALAPFHSAARYFWHAVYMTRGSGKAGKFSESGARALQLPWIVLRANLHVLASLPRLLSQRRDVRRHARMKPKQYARLLKSHSISARRVAAL